MGIDETARVISKSHRPYLVLGGVDSRELEGLRLPSRRDDSMEGECSLLVADVC